MTEMAAAPPEVEGGPPEPAAAAQPLAQNVVQQALAAEGEGDLAPRLPQGARRKHIHYTHVRTNCATDVQPDLILQ